MRKMAATLCLTLAMLVGLPGLATSMDIKAIDILYESPVFSDDPWRDKITLEGWKNHPDEKVLRAPLPYFTILMTGNIVNGDYNKIVSLIKKYGIPYVRIASQGGDVFEAIKIGKLIRKLRISVSFGYNCSSSCFLILAGGVERYYLDGFPFNIKHKERNLIALSKTENAKVCGVKDEYEYKLKYGPNWLGMLRANTNVKLSRIGLHRPRFTKDHYRLFGFENHEKSYRKLIKHVQEYLKSMDIPNQVIERMMSTSSNDIYWMCKETYQSLRSAPFWHELMLAKCGSPLMYEEYKMLNDYNYKIRRGRPYDDRSHPEGSVYRFLEAKSRGYQMCNYWQGFEYGKKGFSELGWDLPVRK